MLNKEKLSHLCYFEQRLKDRMTGANVHEFNTILNNIMLLKYLNSEKIDVDDAIYNRIITRLEKI